MKMLVFQPSYSTYKLLFVVFFVFIGLFFSSPSSAQDTESSNQIQERYKQALQKQNFNDAVTALLQMSFLHQKTKDSLALADTYKTLSDLYYQMGVFPKMNEYAQKEYDIRKKKQDISLGLASQNLALSLYLTQKTNEALFYYGEAAENYHKIQKPQEEGDVYTRISIIQHTIGNTQDAILSAKKASDAYSLSKDSLSIANILNNLGYYHRQLGDFSHAINFFNKALDMNRRLVASPSTTETQKALLLINSGVLFRNLNEPIKAKNSFENAFQIYEQQRDKTGMADAMLYLGRLHLLSEETDEALVKTRQAQKYAQEARNAGKEAEALHLIADILTERGDLLAAEKARKVMNSLLDSLENTKLLKNQRALQRHLDAEKNESSFLLVFAEKQKQDLLLNQLRLENENKKNELVFNQQQLALLKSDQDLKNSMLEKQRLEKERINQELMLSRQKSLAEQKEKEILQLQKNREIQELALEKQKLVDKDRLQAIRLLEGEKKAKEQEIESDRKMFSIISFFGVVMLLGLLIISFGFLRLKKLNQTLNQQAFIIKEKNDLLTISEEELQQNLEELKATQVNLEKQHLLLAQKNHDITSSINYTERMQKAIMPNEREFSKYFADAFIILKPRDIVCGDFYWIKSITDEMVVVVAADCTGHGVPGAVMTMIGNSILYEIFAQNDVVRPSQVLQMLDAKIRRMFRADNESSIPDGMDAVVLLVDKENEKTYFSGAKNPLYWVRDGKIEKIKGSKYPIGGSDFYKEKVFEEECFPTQKNDILYLCSDGFQDQFDKNNHKKYLSANLKNLLLNISTKSFIEQKQTILQEFDEWKGDTPQTDDILLMGIKI